MGSGSCLVEMADVYYTDSKILTCRGGVGTFFNLLLNGSTHIGATMGSPNSEKEDPFHIQVTESNSGVVHAPTVNIAAFLNGDMAHRVFLLETAASQVVAPGSDEESEDSHGDNSIRDSHNEADSSECPMTHPQEAKRKRAKRLAMNRASARERRKRKRILLENLEERVSELTKKNNSLQDMNDDLISQVRQKDLDLTQARNILSTLSSAVGPARPLLESTQVRIPDPSLQEQQLLLSMLLDHTQTSNPRIGRVSDRAWSETLGRRQFVPESHHGAHSSSRGLAGLLVGNHHSGPGNIDLLRQLGIGFPGSALHRDVRPSFFGGLNANTVSSQVRSQQGRAAELAENDLTRRITPCPYVVSWHPVLVLDWRSPSLITCGYIVLV